MRTKITTIRRTRVEMIEHITIQKEIDGRLLQARVPNFDSPRYEVSKSLSYKQQQAEALRQHRNLHPEDSTVRTGHHEPTSPDSPNVTMSVPSREEHLNPHIGGSALNNEEWCKNKIKENDNWDIPKSEQIANKISHSMHKHSTATSVTVGAVSGVVAGGAAIGLYHWWCKKQGQEPTKKGYAVCATLGAISGVIAGIATKQHLNTGIRYI